MEKIPIWIVSVVVGSNPASTHVEVFTDVSEAQLRALKINGQIVKKELLAYMGCSRIEVEMSED